MQTIALVARYLALLARERRTSQFASGGDRQPAFQAYQATEASLGLLLVAAHLPAGDHYVIGRELARACALARRLHCAQPASAMPAILAKVNPTLTLPAAHGVALRDCALLGMVTALSATPCYLTVTLATRGSIAHLTLESDGLWEDCRSVFRLAQQVGGRAGLICWTERWGMRWQIVCPMLRPNAAAEGACA